MMKLKVLASGSNGNGYLIHNESECLIIEAGVDFKEIMKAIDFNISIINGCIASHEHLDHSGKIQAYAQKGIKVYSHKETFRGMKHHNFVEINEKKPFMVGRFKIRAFDVVHDVKNYGFLIEHPITGRFCFLTDLQEANFKFNGLDYILVEANYDKQMIDTNDTLYFIRDRVVNSHLSFDSCMEFLSLQDMSMVNEIVLLHASDSNSDIGAFSKKVKETLNVHTSVASKGLEIHFEKEPF